MLYFKEHIKLKDRNSIWTIKKYWSHHIHDKGRSLLGCLFWTDRTHIRWGSDQIKKNTKKVDSFQNWFFVISDHYWTGPFFGIPGPHRGLGGPILGFWGPEVDNLALITLALGLISALWPFLQVLAISAIVAQICLGILKSMKCG